jgi:hypothetical protein
MGGKFLTLFVFFSFFFQNEEVGKVGPYEEFLPPFYFLSKQKKMSWNLFLLLIFHTLLQMFFKLGDE